MAKPDKLTAEQQEIVRAQNDARLRLPADLNERLKLIADHRLLLARQKDAVAEAKEEHDTAGSLKVLTTRYGLLPQAVKTINLLASMEPPKRSAALRQIIGHGEDEGWIISDLFDHGAVGVVANDDAGEAAVFDSTSEGKRRGGKAAEPRTVQEMAASNVQPAPTPGISLDEAVKQLEAYRAANPPKAGRKPKELKQLEAQVEAAKAAHNVSKAEPVAEIADLPEAQPGEITAGLREGTAAAEAHIRDQVEANPAVPPAEAEAAPEKPKRTRAKKTAAEPAPSAPPVEAGPAAPPPLDDDEDDTLPEPGTPMQRPDAIGNQPSTFTIR